MKGDIKMKKTTIAIILITLLTFVTGCSNTKDVSINKTNSKTNTDSSKETTITEETVKNSDDSKLIEMSQEPSTSLDNLDLQEEDLTAQESLLNEKDPIADIPAKVELK
jgi:hypothetical protein